MAAQGVRHEDGPVVAVKAMLQRGRGEGLSLAMLRVMPLAAQAEVPRSGADEGDEEADAQRASAGVSG